MSGDSSVYVPTLTTGTKIDVNELQTTTGTVERQRVEIPGQVQVTSDTLSSILAELRVISQLLAEGMQVQTNIDQLRADFSGKE